MPSRHRKRRSASKEVIVHPALPVTPSDALPGSEDKIQVLADRYAQGRLLHVEGDLVKDGEKHIPKKRLRNGADVSTREVSISGKPDSEKKYVRNSTDHSSPHSQQPGMLLCGDRVARFLAQWRSQRGLSYGQVSRRTGLSTSHLRKLETGKLPNPRLSTLIALAEVAGVSLDVLAGFTGRKEGDRSA